MNAPSSSTSFSLIVANLVLGAIVIVPVLMVLGAMVREAVGKLRRHRSIVWMEIEGVGRIPVLRE